MIQAAPFNQGMTPQGLQMQGLQEMFLNETTEPTLGTAVSYQYDYGTATATLDTGEQFQKPRVVKYPTTTYNQFAGVIVSARANDNGTGYIALVAQPGSVVQAYLNTGDAVVNNSIYSFRISTGKIYATAGAGLIGPGAFRALQSKTGAADDNLVSIQLLNGPDNGYVDVVTETTGAVTTISSEGTTIIPAAAGSAGVLTYTLPSGSYQRQVKIINKIAATTNLMNISLTAGTVLSFGPSAAAVSAVPVAVAASNGIVMTAAGSGKIALEWLGGSWQVQSLSVAGVTLS